MGGPSRRTRLDVKEQAPHTECGCISAHGSERSLFRDTKTTTVPTTPDPRPGILDVPVLQGPWPGGPASPQRFSRRKKRH